MEGEKWLHVDLFSGIGGFALAAAWTGRIETIGFCEIEPFCRRVLAKHWPGVVQHDDVHTLTGEIVSGWAMGRTVSLITGGFPCTPFSAAGKRRGQEDDRYLWPEMHRVIREVRPTYVLAENVPGIIRMEGGLDRVLADLDASGYTTGTVVVPAAAVGAPHRRDRVWIIAYADRHGEPVSTLDGDAGRGQLRARDVADAPRRGVRRGEAPGPGGLAAQRGQDAADAVPAGSQDGYGGSSGRRRTHPEPPGADGGGPWPEVSQTLSRLGDAPDGLPGWLSRESSARSACEGEVNADEARESEAVSTSFPGHPTVRGVRDNGARTEASRGLRETGRGEVPLSVVSHETRYGAGHLGEPSQEELQGYALQDAANVPDLREELQQLHTLSGEDVLAGVLERIGPAQRDEAVASRFPRPAFGPAWEDGCPRVTAHEEDRVSKLKALGNAIVPQVAYELMLMMLAVDDAEEDEDDRR